MQNTKEEFIYKTLVGTLDAAERIIKKAIEHVGEGKATEEEIINARLIDDMMPFVKQIQILSDNVKGGISRLSGSQNPKYDDDEATLADLLKRVYRTREFVLTISPESMKGMDELTIKLPWMPEGMSWTGKQYAEGFVFQNTYFHLVTAYDIVRMKGVNIGKMDFIGQI